MSRNRSGRPRRNSAGFPVYEPHGQARPPAPEITEPPTPPRTVIRARPAPAVRTVTNHDVIMDNMAAAQRRLEEAVANFMGTRTRIRVRADVQAVQAAVRGAISEDDIIPRENVTVAADPNDPTRLVATMEVPLRLETLERVNETMALPEPIPPAQSVLLPDLDLANYYNPPVIHEGPGSPVQAEPYTFRSYAPPAPREVALTDATMRSLAETASQLQNTELRSMGIRILAALDDPTLQGEAREEHLRLLIREMRNVSESATQASLRPPRAVGTTITGRAVVSSQHAWQEQVNETVARTRAHHAAKAAAREFPPGRMLCPACKGTSSQLGFMNGYCMRCEGAKEVWVGDAPEKPVIDGDVGTTEYMLLPTGASKLAGERHLFALVPRDMADQYMEAYMAWNERTRHLLAAEFSLPNYATKVVLGIEGIVVRFPTMRTAEAQPNGGCTIQPIKSIQLV